MPAPVWLIGTYNQDDAPNIMTVAWGSIACSKPPAIAIFIRPATYTYGNIVDKKAFTVNIPSEKHIRETDLAGMISGRDGDKFCATGLTAVRGEHVDAPYVEECPLILECRLFQTNKIGMHTQFIGEIMDVKADEAVIGEKELPDIQKVSPLIFVPVARKYHNIGKHLGDAFSIGKELADK